MELLTFEFILKPLVNEKLTFIRFRVRKMREELSCAERELLKKKEMRILEEFLDERCIFLFRRLNNDDCDPTGTKL